MSTVKSRARVILDKIQEQDTQPDVPGDQQPPEGGQPDAGNPDAPDLQQMAQDPMFMGEAVDGMADMCDRYMDEEDSDTWTPGDDQEKQDTMEAGHMLREAAMRLKRAKKAK